MKGFRPRFSCAKGLEGSSGQGPDRQQRPVHLLQGQQGGERGAREGREEMKPLVNFIIDILVLRIKI